MRPGLNFCRAAILMVFLGFVAGSESAHSNSKSDLVGRIRRLDGRPIVNARATIYRSFAGYRRRHILIPGSADVSKRARTDSTGKFRISGLDTNAKFQVLFEADGFRPAFYYRVNALDAQEVTLSPVPQSADPKSRARGRVTDDGGNPIRGALVRVVGAAHRDEGWQSTSGPDIESIAFTDEGGTFAIRGEGPFIDVDVMVEAAGFAQSALVEAVETGKAFREIRLMRGGSVRGRLVKDGQMVAHAGVGLTMINNGSINGSLEIMTNEKGEFHFLNVLSRRDYHLFGIMESLLERGSVPIQRVHVDEGAETNVGDLEVRPGFVLSGNVRFDDGTPAPHNCMITICRTVTEGGREENLDCWETFLSKGKEGRFEFAGVPAEPVSLFIIGPPLYHLSPANVNSDPSRYRLLGRVTGNKTNLLFEIVRGEQRRELAPVDSRALLKHPLRGAEK